MNRLRHAYLELAPELAPYFVTGHTDDEAGVMCTHGGPANHPSVSRVLASTPALMAILDAVVAGVLAALGVRTFGGGDAVAVVAAVASSLAVAVLLFSVPFRGIRRIRREWSPRFPA